MRNAGCLVLIMAVFFLRQDAKILRKYQQPLVSLERLSNPIEIGVLNTGNDELNTDENAPKISKPLHRPFLILHVGPPKTATTTFQQGFFENREALGRDDNLMYVGQPPKARQPRITSWQDDRNNTETTLISYPMNMLVPFPKKDACKHLKHHLKHKRNVVVSSEHFTSHWFMGDIQSSSQASRFVKLYDLLFLRNGANTKCKDPARYKVNKDENTLEQVWNDDTSQQFAFDVKIVVTYRHYFEWLPSFYYQWELVNHPNNVPTLRQFIEDALDKLPQQYFEEHNDYDKTNLWHHDAFTTPQRVHGPLYSYLRWSSPAALRNRVELFDLHQQQFEIGNDENKEQQQQQHGLFTKLICQSIPAPNLCHQRRDEDAANIKEQRVRVKTNSRHVFRTGLLNDMLVKQIHSKARDYFPELKRNKTQVPRTYNFDPTRNIYLTKEMQRPNPNFRPVELNFYYWAQQQQNKTNQHDDKVLCLSAEQLDRFRLVSWNMLVHLHYLARQSSHEHYVVPESTLLDHPLLLAPHIPATGNSNSKNPSRVDWKRLQQAHDDAFWEAFNQGIYCELDWEALMDNDEFVETVFYSQSYDKISARKRREIQQHLGIKRPTPE